ncbi:MAG: universal stress protein [Acidobacteria bacterium]|nr:universal stress protein [Acidobacteriota bacterium]
MRIEKILVPTDFSENAQLAFDEAYNLARQLGAKLYLLHVQDESTLRTAIKEGLLHPGATDEEVQAQVEKLTEMRFSRMLAGRIPSECPVEHLTRRGDPKVTIPDYANEIKADMVVVGKHGATAMTRIKTALLGSVAEAVIRKSPCPVLVVVGDRKR